MKTAEGQFNKPPVYGQWIDVKSLEPESPDMVNIILEDGFRSVGRKYSNGWGVFFMDGEDLIKPDSGKRQVTHWMPLPPSPGSVDVEEKKVDGLGDSSGSEVNQDELIIDLDDKRILKFNRSLDENMWYLSRKQTAESLLDKYTITRKP